MIKIIANNKQCYCYLLSPFNHDDDDDDDNQLTNVSHLSKIISIQTNLLIVYHALLKVIIFSQILTFCLQ